MRVFRFISLPLAALLLLIPGHLKAGERLVRFTTGVEWGGTIGVAMNDRFCYRSHIGYLVRDEVLSVNPIFNGDVLISAGIDVGKYVNISVYGGYEGIDKACRGYPLTLRTTVMPYSDRLGGVLLHAGGGVVFPEMLDSPVMGIALAGAGYRFRITRTFAVDLLMGYRLGTRAPELVDPDTSMPVPENRIMDNRRILHGINFSIALRFSP